MSLSKASRWESCDASSWRGRGAASKAETARGAAPEPGRTPRAFSTGGKGKATKVGLVRTARRRLNGITLRIVAVPHGPPSGTAELIVIQSSKPEEALEALPGVGAESDRVPMRKAA